MSAGQESERETLIHRLRGQYAVGKGDPPEFGFRQFETPSIQHEAAAALERLQARVEELEKTGDALLADARDLRAANAGLLARVSTLGDSLAAAEAERDALRERAEALEELLRRTALRWSEEYVGHAVEWTMNDDLWLASIRAALEQANADGRVPPVKGDAS